DNKLLLSDFGVARIVQDTLSHSTRGPAGTPTYMAPEQFRGKPQPASDQYALAAMAYEWLCGRPPFEGKDFLILMDHHILQAVPSLKTRNPSIPKEVEEVLQKALAKEPYMRFPDIEAFAEAFKRAI